MIRIILYICCYIDTWSPNITHSNSMYSSNLTLIQLLTCRWANHPATEQQLVMAPGRIQEWPLLQPRSGVKAASNVGGLKVTGMDGNGSNHFLAVCMCVVQFCYI